MSENKQGPQVERLELGKLACWRVRTAEAELLVAQQGAQILSYQRLGEPPLIWLSEQAEYQQGQSVRGGIPVCWPWFGDLKRNPQAVQGMHEGGPLTPAHGLVRGLDWELQTVDRQAQGVHLALRCAEAEQGLPGWPHSVALSLDIRLGDSLQVRLSSRNLGEQPVSISQALHSYFAVSDVRQVSVEGLDQCRYVDALEDDWRAQRHSGELRIAGETDRLFLDLPSRLAILDPHWQRRIILETSGSHSAVLWNPWVDKAKRLSQFAEDAWQGMLCIETANVLDDLVELAPGEQHQLAVTLRSEALPAQD